jgi:transposase
MKPYSMDLREKIIKAWKTKSYTLDQLAETFSVNKSTVQRYIKKFKETNSLKPMPHRGGKRQLIGFDNEFFIKKLLK